MVRLSSENEVYAWGNNTMGQCGQGHTSTPITRPKKVLGLEGVSIQQITAGTSHSLAWTAVPTDRCSLSTVNTRLGVFKDVVCCLSTNRVGLLSLPPGNWWRGTGRSASTWRRARSPTSGIFWRVTATALKMKLLLPHSYPKGWLSLLCVCAIFPQLQCRIFHCIFVCPRKNPMHVLLLVCVCVFSSETTTSFCCSACDCCLSTCLWHMPVALVQ